MNPIATYLAAAREAELARRRPESTQTIRARRSKRRLRLRHLVVTVVVVGTAAWPLTSLAQAAGVQI